MTIVFPSAGVYRQKKAGDNRREQATCLDDIIGVNKKYFFSFPAGVARKE
jgi:hypothetical protein